MAFILPILQAPTEGRSLKAFNPVARSDYQLGANIPRSRRRRITAFGHRVMGASVLRQLHLTAFYAEAA